jgi:hypothetical protein
MVLFIYISFHNLNMSRKKKELNYYPTITAPISINLNESRWNPRTENNNNGLDKYAIAALTQQNSFTNLLAVSTLFNNNNNNNRGYDRDNCCHHRHHHDRYDRYPEFVPVFMPMPSYGYGPYQGYGPGIPDIYYDRPRYRW